MGLGDAYADFGDPFTGDGEPADDEAVAVEFGDSSGAKRTGG